ncbi:MAG: hypothetical protein HYV41_01195 [Candidatus Magasanikbacteria bacterium]|nr:hypothetical protein [Candidatus Magasanikbacteria bacterium]
MVTEKIRHFRPDLEYGIKIEDAQKKGTLSLSHEFEEMWKGGKKSHMLNVFNLGSREAQEQCIVHVVDELLSKIN